jgi:hypothetical protein
LNVLIYMPIKRYNVVTLKAKSIDYEVYLSNKVLMWKVNKLWCKTESSTAKTQHKIVNCFLEGSKNEEIKRKRWKRNFLTIENDKLKFS